eukprot:1195171-Prorocentrum_minimum.AAC.5
MHEGRITGALGPLHGYQFAAVDAGGGMVALHSRSNNRFVRMDPWGKVDSEGGARGADDLPADWDWERFRVRVVTEAELFQVR